MAWAEFRKTKSGTARKFNEEKEVWETGTYYARERIGGKIESRPTGSGQDTRKQIIRDMEEERIKYKYGKPESPALKIAYGEYELFIKKFKSKNTWRIYKWGLDKLMDFFDGMKVSDIAKADILKFRTSIMRSHNVNGTMDILKYVRTFFSYCIESGYIELNPASGALKGLKESEVAHFLSTEEIKHILSCNRDEELADIVKVALMTGMRQEEIANMRTSWLKKDSIHVLGKGNKYRQIPIFSKVRPILEKRLSTGDVLIFPGWNIGRIRQAWKRIVHRARKTMPLKRTRFHDLRHTFASNYLQDGGRIPDLKLIMGHASIVTTMKYAHLETTHLSSQMEKMKAEFLDEAPAQLNVI